MRVLNKERIEVFREIEAAGWRMADTSADLAGALKELLADREDLLAEMRAAKEEAERYAGGRTCPYCKRVADRLAAALNSR